MSATLWFFPTENRTKIQESATSDKECFGQHMIVWIRHSEVDPETLPHYFIIIETLKWNFSDNKMCHGSRICLRMAAKSSSFFVGK